MVQHYELDLHLTHRTFPVRFTETGQWQLLTARDVTVVQTHGRSARPHAVGVCRQARELAELLLEHATAAERVSARRRHGGP